MSEFSSAKGKYESRYVVADGIKTHYLDVGSGVPVILLHGGGAGADSFCNWFRCIDAFAGSFRVIAMDLLGFGATDKPDPVRFVYSQEVRNQHMIAAIEALNLGPVHMVGNSMGGSTSIGVSVQRPELVRKLVLMGSAGINTPPSPALLPIYNYDFTRAGMIKVCQALANKSFEIDDDMVDYRYQLSTTPDTRAAYAAAMGWIKEQGGLFYPDEYIAKVSQPCLVVNGKLDLVAPLACAYRFLELIERSWGYIIPNCGHWAMLEYPQDFAAETIRFLQT